MGDREHEAEVCLICGGLGQGRISQQGRKNGAEFSAAEYGRWAKTGLELLNSTWTLREKGVYNSYTCDQQIPEEISGSDR